jgi:hypothetical protein
MALPSSLLREARRARDKVIRLQLEADRAQMNYQHTIRRLHAEGGSLREIAEALGLSHQRVHQIVETVAGKVALKEPRDLCNCSFCGIGKGEAPKLIAGPGVFICDQCVVLADDVSSRGEPRGNERTRLALVGGRLKCSFCGNRSGRIPRLVAGPGLPSTRLQRAKYPGPSARICRKCLDLCHEIMFEESR